MPQQQPPQQQPGITKGPIHAVPCPQCGAIQDCRELLVADGAGQTLHTNTTISCDECGTIAVIKAIQTVKVLYLQNTGQRDPAFKGPMSAQPPRINTISPNAARKLLGRR
jgi:hypothetical protein